MNEISPDRQQPTPAGRDALRDRIAAAVEDVFERWRDGLGDVRPQDAVTDAIVAVLPPPADRAAVLREGADELDYFDDRYDPNCHCGDCYGCIWHKAAMLLRGMADEAKQQTETHSCRNCEGIDPDSCLMNPKRRQNPGALDRVRHLHDSLAAETDLSGPDDLITKGSAARRIAAALDGWSPEARPARGDQFEAWLKAQRDATADNDHYWGADALLNQYRLHADTGTPLSEHVCEGKVAGDCECLDQPAVVAAVADEEPDTETDEDPARIDRLRPEFFEHSSVEAIDTQLRRARAQERRWHIRTEWLISLRETRINQKARGEWAAASQPGKEEG